MVRVLQRSAVIEITNTQNGHFKFYRGWIEEVENENQPVSVYRVMTQWGRIGTSGQTGKPKQKLTLSGAASELYEILSKKTRKGYRTSSGSIQIPFSLIYNLEAVNSEAAATPAAKTEKSKSESKPKPKQLSAEEIAALEAELAGACQESSENTFSVI